METHGFRFIYSEIIDLVFFYHSLKYGEVQDFSFEFFFSMFLVKIS